MIAFRLLTIAWDVHVVNSACLGYYEHLNPHGNVLAISRVDALEFAEFGHVRMTGNLVIP